MRASACANQGRQREEQAAPPPKKKTEGGGGGGRKQPEATKPPANTTRGGQTPPPEGTKDMTPEEARGDHPAKTGNTKAGTAAHREKGHRKMQTHTTKKKEPAAQPERKGMGGQGPQGSGQKHPAKEKAQKTHTGNPATKGWAQPGPGPSTHAHTARRNRKRRGASGARRKPHTSHKQAKTDPQPRTPQTADTRGTTPQPVPKHTHRRPQPGLAGLTKLTPNRQPDQNTNAAQQ